MSQTAITSIFSKRLEELTEAKKDSNYKLSVKDQAKEMGIPYATFRKYLYDKAECNISYLQIIAKYYNVSTDYLLGLSDCHSSNTTIKDICTYIGLNENVVNDLHTFCIDVKKSDYPFIIDILNKVLETDEFSDIVYNLAFLSNTNNSVALLSHIDVLNIAEKHNIDSEMLVRKWVKTISYTFLGDEFIDYILSPKETDCKYNNVRNIERLNNMFCKSDISTMTRDEIIKLFDEAEQNAQHHKHKPENILTMKKQNE